jgi:hypothetical protein
MFRDKIRFCDVCQEKIPHGTKYKRSHIAPEKTYILDWLLQNGSDVQIEGSRNADGSVSLDICFDCALRMGRLPVKDEMN